MDDGGRDLATAQGRLGHQELEEAGSPCPNSGLQAGRRHISVALSHRCVVTCSCGPRTLKHHPLESPPSAWEGDCPSGLSEPPRAPHTI